MKKILLVDDSELFYDLFRSVFKDHKVIWARDGRSGVEYYSRHRPDVIVIDIILPDMNGVELIKEIKKIDKSAKIIVISGIERSEVMEDAIDAGATEYLPKNIGINVLRKKVEKYMR